MSAVPVNVLNDAIGTLLAGSWANGMLFMLVITQVWSYVVAFPNDRIWIRALVAFMVSVDFVATFNAFAMYTITHWGDPAFLAVQNNTIPVYSMTMAVSVICMHFFLVYRYVVLSKNYFIAFVLVALACTAFVGDSLATWSVVRFTALADRPKLKTFATIWLSASSAADVCIALALIWEFVGVKSSFAKTKSLIRRLIKTAIMTGAITASMAIVTLVVYLAKPQSNICLTFGMCIGRACTLTVLYNLNMRNSSGNYTSSAGRQATVSGNNVPLESGFAFTHGTHHRDATAVNGINVHQMSVVHVDGQESARDDDASFDNKHRGRELV
ncbi:hypothetical protein EXIGLDRAFT_142174 [Exidia glandulosa HHB12029]|uniref:DUF6534 domain-containing protein n=1 Tax=Exidia glandulosa HHB12029 TaxID=1314781 RepID=A0A165FUH1_EXIGL|nr:hypothetical protein EXIGLDRAFT_142174 [Exidia glandulosa HHB12029]